MKTDGKQDAIISGACEMLRPLVAHAYTARQFSDVRQALGDWLSDHGYVPYLTSVINEIGHGLWLDEELAKVNDAEGRQLGLGDAELKERFILLTDLPYANTEGEVKAIRSRVERWLAHFPDDPYADGWRARLQEKQDYLDFMAEVGADADTIPSNPNLRAMERAKYPDPYARKPMPDKHLVGV